MPYSRHALLTGIAASISLVTLGFAAGILPAMQAGRLRIAEALRRGA